MQIFYLEATEDSPEIWLDKTSGNFKITGRSIPENAIEFYLGIREWLGEYKKNPNANSLFVFQLEYFNTASSKVFQDIISDLSEIPGMKINWYYDKGDKTTEETIMEYKENCSIPFEMIEM